MLFNKIKTLVNNKKSILKNNCATKPTNSVFHKEIQAFMSNDFNVDNDKAVTQFFYNLHKKDYLYLFDKTFYIKLYEFNRNVSGVFAREEDTQFIIFNKIWCTTAPSKLKKSILLNTYFHENTHEKQYDKYIYLKAHKKLKGNAFQRILNFEFSTKEIPQYNFQLKEIDARMTSLHRFCELLKLQVISYSPDFALEPVTSLFKNVFALTNLSNKENYFNKKEKIYIDENIADYSKLTDIKFETDNYMKLYEKFLHNSKENSIELKEAKKIFENTKLKYELKKQLDKKFNTYKQDILFLYKLIQKTYKPSLGLYRFMPKTNAGVDKLENMKENHQMLTLKLLEDEYYSYYMQNKEYERD